MLKLKIAVLSAELLAIIFLGVKIHSDLNPEPVPVPPVEEPSFPDFEEWPRPTAKPWTQTCGVHASEHLDALVEEVAQETDLEPALLAAVIRQESTCRPTAIGKAGEIGLAQIHPKWWSGELVEAELISVSDDLLDPGTNLRAAAYILNQQLERSDGDIKGALRRYNGRGLKARRYVSQVYDRYLELSGLSEGRR